MSALILYLLLGATVGVLAGLLGIGGGLIIVPALVFALQHQGVGADLAMRIALGTSLATIVVTAAASVRAHHHYGAVRWSIVRSLMPGIVLGALLGALAADAVPGEILRQAFGLFELLIAAQLAFGASPPPTRRLPGRWGMGAAGSGIGLLSALLGIGGGTLTAPFLIWRNVSLREAVATSAACGLPLAIAGGIGYIAAGWDESGLPRFSSGYIYWPAFAAIAVGSSALAPLGARLAQRAPAALLRRLFAVVLVLVGLRMLGN